MHTELTSSEIALRLLLSFAAGAILGANRGQQGRAAGLRTTVLVCLTASSSMILANLLLRTTGRAPDSFVSMDVMRLPLGILTGMGFIGAGAILHRENMILGVTTAATLWFTTLMGFCFGSGELGLALSLLGLGVFVLWCLEWVEAYWTQRLEAVLVVIVTPDGPSHEEIAQALQGQHYNLSAPAVKYHAGRTRVALRSPLARIASRHSNATPDHRTCRATWGKRTALESSLGKRINTVRSSLLLMLAVLLLTEHSTNLLLARCVLVHMFGSHKRRLMTRKPPIGGESKLTKQILTSARHRQSSPAVRASSSAATCPLVQAQFGTTFFHRQARLAEKTALIAMRQPHCGLVWQRSKAEVIFRPSCQDSRRDDSLDVKIKKTTDSGVKCPGFYA